MTDNREVDLAAAALTKELMKLCPHEEEQRAALAVTIENAISRLAVAILAQSRDTPKACPSDAVLTSMSN
jgi:hypothetical protein